MKSKAFFFSLVTMLLSQTLLAQVTLPGETESNWFKGSRVKIEGTLAASAIPDGVMSGIKSGFVHVYEKNNNQWQLVAQLQPDNAAEDDRFGFSLDISQGKIFIGAFAKDHMIDGENYSSSGSVYVFEKLNGVWQQTHELIASNASAQDGFGYRVEAAPGRVFVSKADLDSAPDEPSGGVYVFDLINKNWTQTSFIDPADVLGVYTTFGLWDISYDQGNLLVPNYYRNDVGSITNDVYSYRLNGAEWQLEQVIQSPSGLPNDWFGSTISLEDDRLAIAAVNERTGAGAVYVYERVDGQWDLVHKFEPTRLTDPSNFGTHVALGHDQIIIGSRHEIYTMDGDYDEGQVFVFNHNNGFWTLQDVLEAPGDRGHNDFGENFDFDHDQLIVGAPYTDDTRGAAYIFDIQPVQQRLPLNAGLNGNWFNPDTSGQGIFLDVSTALDFSFMGWFTYDTQSPDDEAPGQIAAAGQRWLVGAGELDHNTSSIRFQLYYSYDGLFDDPRTVITTDVESYGSLLMEFKNCGEALVTYHLFESGVSGSFPVYRPTAGSADLCADLAASSQIMTDFDYSLNGAWFNPETPGQGFFVDKFKGIDTTFMGWFTYDTALPAMPVDSVIGADGQRWLVGQGAFDASEPNVLNYELYYTFGGLFDDPTEVTVVAPGAYGKLRIEFNGCTSADVTYEIQALGLSGDFSLIRAVPNGDDCGMGSDTP